MKCEMELTIDDVLADLKSCSLKRDLSWGRIIHLKALEINFNAYLYISNALITMYGKSKSMIEAQDVFDNVQTPNVVSWTALLSGYAEAGNGHACLTWFYKMKASGFSPDSVTYVAVLKSCAANTQGTEKQCLQNARNIHSEIGPRKMNNYVQNTLIYMYSKFGAMKEARRVFADMQKPNVVSWTALILGYAENGEGRIALDMFSRMKASGCVPDCIAYVAALKACTVLAVTEQGNSQCLEHGKKIHSEIGCHLNQYSQNALIDMYSKCGDMVLAHEVFNNTKYPNVVSWTALILGYVENGEGYVGLDIFCRMKASSCAPDTLTYVATFKACALIGALGLGRKFHSQISEFNFEVVTSLVDFYAKCGSMVESRKVFDLHAEGRSIPTWNALLAGYGSFGDIDSMFTLFERMQEQGYRPNDVTFVCVLLACSHAGLVLKASEYFEAMTLKYNVFPNIKHYNCMVDVLGRKNELNKALALIKNMPCKPDSVIWMTLLGACCKWKNIEIGRDAFEALVDISKKNGPAYVLMARLYSKSGMWKEQQRLLQDLRS